MTPDPAAGIIRYHEQTKHHFDRFARSPGYMDWQNQPNPFRFFKGVSSVSLPLLSQDPATGYRDLYRCRDRAASPFDTPNVAGFLELSLGLSAWKAAGGSQWSLRINPSSGNLHPTEAYLLTPRLGSTAAGVYHYNPFQHALEKRAALPDPLWVKIRDHFQTECFLIGLTSIFWRETWKYGERAYRYCNHDVGHAVAALSLAAHIFGWKAIYLNVLSDRDIERLLGLDRTDFPDGEKEHPDLVCVVCPHDVPDVPRGLGGDIPAAFGKVSFQGTPNQLSRETVRWDLVDRAAEWARKPATGERRYPAAATAFVETPPVALSATDTIRNRRSAVDFDPRGSIGRQVFLAMLDKTLPRGGIPPFNVELGRPAIDLLLFVHAVDGLAPGVYFFLRCGERHRELRSCLRGDFLWQPVEPDVPLYLLERKDCRRDARIVSCDQEIAGASAYSLGMIAQFKDFLDREPYRYRQLFWEAGMIGQVLYLEAEAHGVRGTGIGCYFDDAVHDMIGLEDNRYQSLYHFTVGRPVDDPRLKTYPPYQHLQKTDKAPVK